MIPDFKSYTQSEKPELRPFSVDTDLPLIDDYMMDVRLHNPIVSNKASILEFVTFDFRLLSIADLQRPEDGADVHLVILVHTPLGTHRMATKRLAGVNDDGLWFIGKVDSHVAYISAAKETQFKRDVQAELERENGPGYMERWLKEAISAEEGGTEGPDMRDPDWWKKGG